MSYLDDIRTALVALVAAVPDAGIVHPYQRYAASLPALKELYVSDIGGGPKLRGWYVSRIAVRESSVAPGCHEVVNDWLIRGYMALEDVTGSEIVFDNLVEAIRDRLRGDDTLGLFGTTVFENEETSGAQAPEIGPVMFAGVLCHAARIAISTCTHFKEIP